MNRRMARALITAAIIAAALVGCRAAPAPSVGFADPANMKSDPNVPFNRFWRKPGVNWNQYTKIYVAEVNTAYMLKLTDWQAGERRGDIEKDVQTVAVYMHDSIAKAFRDDPHHRFSVIDVHVDDPHVLVLEVALIEVVPSKVLLNALGYAPFFIGTGINVVRTVASDKSTAAFEARVRDASTNEVVMLAADREAEQLSPVDVRGLTWYSDVYGIIDDWSRQFLEITSKKAGEKVEGFPTFRLLPW
jgi:hypothetical protein